MLADVVADAQSGQYPGFGQLRGGLAHDDLQVLIVDLFFLVRHLDEAVVDGIYLLIGDLVAQVFEPFAHSVLARSRPEGQYCLGPADILRLHDFVGLPVHEHTMLVYACFMAEGVLADDSFVGLHRKAGEAGDHLRSLHDFASVDVGVGIELVGAGA